jgi:hypothetical protein
METYYAPSPAEIAAECAAIRAGWSDAERLQRRRGVNHTRLLRGLARRRRQRTARRLLLSWEKP